MLASAFYALPNLHAQAAFLMIEVVLLVVAVDAGAAVVAKALRDHPAKARIIERTRKDSKKNFGVDFDPDAAWASFCSMFVVGTHHLLSALLFLPAILALGDATWTVPLACLGGLSECAHDLYDSVRCLYRYSQGTLPGGRKFLTVTFLHHACSLLLIVPLNASYMDLPTYQVLAFELMGAGGAAILASNFLQLMDSTTVGGLNAMRAVATLSFVLMAGTRWVHFGPLVAGLAARLAADGRRGTLAVGSLALAAMTAFNCIIVPDAYRRMRKFFRMRPAGEARTTPEHRGPTTDAAAIAGAAEEDSAETLLRQMSSGVISVDTAVETTVALERIASGDWGPVSLRRRRAANRRSAPAALRLPALARGKAWAPGDGRDGTSPGPTRLGEEIAPRGLAQRLGFLRRRRGRAAA